MFGLSGGLTPGPLLALVMAQTLRFGVKEGVKVAAAPLLTDLPIVAAAVAVTAALSDIEPVLGVISLCGGAFLVYLGWESLSFHGADRDAAAVSPRSIRKGVAANFLNPSPYLFWFTIGAPTLLEAARSSAAAAVLFVGAFYLCLVGAKVVVAWAAGRSRRLLRSGMYIATVRILGGVLLLFAILFFRAGLAYLGAW